jgi:replicative DNA helicase
MNSNHTDEVSRSHKEIEQTLLGAILINPHLIYEAMEKLKVEDLFYQSHKILYSAMLSLYHQEKCIDERFLQIELEDKGDFERIGGMAFFAELTEGMMRENNLDHYIGAIRKASEDRRIARLSSLAYSLSKDLDLSTEAKISRLESALFEVQSIRKRGFRLLGDIVRERLDAYEDNKGKQIGIPSGFNGLDFYTTGWHPGQLIVVAARPAAGKTSFGTNCILNAASRGYKVGFFSLEMSCEDIADRTISSVTEIDSGRAKHGILNKSEWSELAQALQHFQSLPIYVDDDPDLTINQMRSSAKRLKAEHGLDLLVVDYMQLFEGDEKDENRQQAVAKISRSMKKTAKDLNIPLIALSQLNRGVENRTDHKPHLADLRDSGAIEQDADIVIFLYRPEMYSPCAEEDKGFTDVILAKHRNGSLGTVRLAYKPQFTKFESIQE